MGFCKGIVKFCTCSINWYLSSQKGTTKVFVSGKEIPLCESHEAHEGLIFATCSVLCVCTSTKLICVGRKDPAPSPK